MRFQQQGSPTPHRRDVLGFFKSVVEFFTGVIGMTTAALGILGTVAAFALAGSTTTPPEPPREPTSTPISTTPSPTLTSPVAIEDCAALTDPVTSAAVLSALAEEFDSGSTPLGFEDELAPAVDDFELAAIAAALGDPDAAELDAEDVFATLGALGIDC